MKKRIAYSRNEIDNVKSFKLNTNNMTLPDELAFLRSVRFWKLVTAAVISIIAQLGYMDPAIAGSIALLLGADVTIRTVDRFSETLKQ